ncbi:hypothetical protein GCM10011344_26280 [Dokdonia pacifica]|uniref:Lycopene cyclase domain-containing protein n=1 Tax=Dokdonia pacifica TaxID=1627892 RepID=A0A239E3L2_9FLAO|nr:hypothetical protein [Dokdonia pacifica]GGG24288.1 hypothetical protein GCM10011344_26280 [Dokdonia pacifica]SNS38991.1 hypothetical protein SAMN06265376_11371 [Dokdonia pacifica]
MKNAIKLWPYAICLLPQFFITDYLWYMIIIIAIGFLAKFVVRPKNVFVTLFVLELVTCAILFLVFNDRVFYLNGIFENLKLPALLSPVAFILFNAINMTVLFFTGYTLGKVVSIRKTIPAEE